MMIFDGFSGMAEAGRVAGEVSRHFKRRTLVTNCRDWVNAVDPFPGVLNLPALLVEREDDLSGEEEVIRFIAERGGEYAGT